jgi:hypothetical protein
MAIEAHLLSFLKLRLLDLEAIISWRTPARPLA